VTGGPSSAAEAYPTPASNGETLNPAARIFAEWALALRVEDLPADLTRRLGIRVADAIGLVAAGWDTAPGRAVRSVNGTVDGPSGGVPLLFDTAPLAPANAALVHGALIHTLDYDDTFPSSVIHPSSVLFAAAWAAASEHTPGQRVLTALAAGDEFLARVGAMAGRGLHARGFQATSVFGPLAAALVAGVVRGRSPATIAAAMGLAGSMSGGLLEFLSDGSWSKRLHPGWAAHGGIVADDLSAAGFPGPPSILEGRHGLFSSFLQTEIDPATLIDGLGTTWVSDEVELKLFPCAHVIHPFLELALAQRAHGRTPDDIESIVCGVAPWYVPIVCEPRAEKLDPAGEYQARTSLFLGVALALVDGRVDDLSYSDESVARPEVRDLAQRITHLADPELEGGFGARLSLILRDGRRIEAKPGPTGSLEERVAAKFGTGLSRLPTAPTEAQVAELWRAATTIGNAPWGELRSAAAGLS
jgi:2-methylcitrate dehydratase PrpD